MTSFLHGGRKRRRFRGRLAVLVAVVAPLAAGATLYFVLIRGDGGRDAAPRLAAVGPAPGSDSHSPLARLQAPRTPHVPLFRADAFRLRLRKPPRAGLVFDARTGRVLWRLHPLKRLPIASLTKIMTALLVTERAGPDERVLITKDSLHYQGSGVGVLPKRKRVRLESLLNGLLIVSGNDAAIALADHIAGTERRFVRLMNARARGLGLRCTHFVSSHGLQPGNRSCAHDLAVLARLAMARRRIRRVVRRRRAVLPFPIKGGRLFLYGHNPLMKEGYRGTIGLKTGFTDEAGRCFVGVAKRGGRTLGVVLLGSPNPAKHAPRLLDLGFRAERG
ncbi:MAG: D-alanyl-D-alanine carboxypeptidase family protein [Thermoleophilaceae bacterium]